MDYLWRLSHHISLEYFHQILQKIPSIKIKRSGTSSVTTFIGTQKRWQTNYIIINMICCSAMLQKVKANFRKIITLLWLKEKQHRNSYKVKCFCTKLCIKGFFSCLIHYFFKSGVAENSTRQTLVSIYCFYCRTLFNKLIIEHTFISTKHYQNYVLTLV